MQKARKKRGNVESKLMFYLNTHCDRFSSSRKEMYYANTSYHVQQFIVFSHINKSENLYSVTTKLAESGNGNIEFFKSLMIQKKNLFFRKLTNTNCIVACG
jgi:hypothetical protein